MLFSEQFIKHDFFFPIFANVYLLSWIVSTFLLRAVKFFTCRPLQLRLGFFYGIPRYTRTPENVRPGNEASLKGPRNGLFCHKCPISPSFLPSLP